MMWRICRKCGEIAIHGHICKPPAASAGYQCRGLKDHEIAELVNALTTALKPFSPFGCLREVVSRTTVNYLNSKKLRVDDQTDRKSVWDANSN